MAGDQPALVRHQTEFLCAAISRRITDEFDMGNMTAAAGYDCVVCIMAHNLSDDGAKQSITVIGLKTSRVARAQGDDLVCQ